MKHCIFQLKFFFNKKFQKKTQNRLNKIGHIWFMLKQNLIHEKVILIHEKFGHSIKNM
jgi:hypothetical protein